ncbi:MAG: hypothetical protein KAH21_12250 [Spirochaetaceae bacterium]|nr:hypothetical protein [Spirochaetaceae bacterium]
MNNSLIRFGKLVLLAVVFLALISCASVKTQQEQYVESVPLAREGLYDQASLIIEAAKGVDYKEKDRVLYYLDQGMLYHWDKEYELSNEMLSKAEDAIEELFTKSVSKAMASGVLNDNALDYSGEDYEDIYLNVFKSLNYIALGDEESALVEIRRVQIKLNLLEDKYKKLVEDYNSSQDAEGELEYKESQFHNDVLARYLSLLLYRSGENWDDARIDSESIHEAWDTQKSLYNFPQPTLPRVIPVDENQAIVNVVSFSGMSPVKLADTFYINTGPNIVFLTMTGQSDEYVTDLVGFNFLIIPGVQAGFHFKVQFPRLSSRRSEADRVIVKFDGAEVAEIPMLEKMENIARETFLLKQPLTIGKTIIRATIKNVTKEIGKDAMQDGLSDQGAGGFIVGLLAGIAADVAVDATENADLRISQFFPSYARAAEIAVPPGTYHVTIEYWNGNNLMREVDHGTQSFSHGGLNLIESYMLQ